MTGLFEALTMVLVAACFLTSLGSIYYVLWFAFRRRDAHAKVRSVDSWARRESRWGMLMASPLLFAVLAAAASPGTWWWVSLLSVVAIGLFYSIPVLAFRGVRLPPLIRWLPAAVVLPALPVLLAISAIQGDLFGALVWFTFAGGLGIGYLAECMVAVRFARAVGRRDAEAAHNVEDTLVGADSNFVWPS